MQKSDLLKSHDVLRAFMRLAETELKKRGIGRKDSPLLQLMSRTLHEARIVAPTLAEIGISKDTSALAQKIASLPA
jgi:hypothetical protein